MEMENTGIIFGIFDKHKRLMLTILLGVVVLLCLANAVYIGTKLPNFARSYVEGVHSFDLNIPENRNSVYGPIYTSLSRVNMYLFGKNWSLNYLLINSFHFMMLLTFSYLLGKEVKDKETGILSALLICLYPLTSASLNRYIIDFPLMGIMVMWIYFLFKSKMLLDTKWSVMVGLASLYGLFMKQPFAAFIAGPLLCVLFLAIQNSSENDFKRLKTFCLLMTIVIFFIYLYYYGELYFYICKLYFVEKSGNQWYSWDNLRLFTSGLWDCQLSVPFFLIFAASIIPFVRDKGFQLKTVIVLWILVPNIIILLMPHTKTERLLIPQLPAFALISALWLRKVLYKPFGILLIIAVTVIGVSQIYAFTYDKYGLSELNYKSYYYWDAYDLSLSFPKMKRESAYSENIGKALLEDILQREKNNGKTKNSYQVIFTYDNFPLEAFLVRSFFLMNSSKTIVPYFRLYLFGDLLKSEKLPHIDYIVHIMPYGSKNVCLSDILSEWVRSIDYDRDENIWRKYQVKEYVKWDQLLSNFNEVAKIENIGPGTVYIYGNVTN